MPSPAQLHTSSLLIKSSLLLQLTGLIWGLFVGSAPYPRLALVAHIEAMSNSAMFMGTGLLLRSNYLSLSPKQLKAVLWGDLLFCVPIAIEAINGWWGAKEMLPLAAGMAGVTKGAAVWQEMVVNATHIIPGCGIIVTFAVLVFAAFTRADETEGRKA